MLERTKKKKIKGGGHATGIYQGDGDSRRTYEALTVAGHFAICQRERGGVHWHSNPPTQVLQQPTPLPGLERGGCTEYINGVWFLVD